MAGVGTTLDPALVTLPIGDWASGAGSGGQWYSNDALVYGISAGAGSGAGAGYHAFADNVTLDINGNPVTYNFELTAAPVPELASLAVWSLIGLTADES